MKRVLLSSIVFALTACADAAPPTRAVDASAATRVAATSPSFVIILLDDARADMMTRRFLPRSWARIADSGTVFARAYVNTALCCPSRSTLLTGLYQHHHGVLSNVFAQNGGALFFHDQQTVATALQQAGYATSLVGKYMNQYYRLTPWPYVPPGWSDWRALKDSASGGVGYYDFITVERPLGSGTTTEVSHGASPADYQTSVLGATAVRFIKAVPATQPLFLYITPYAPHEPSVPAPQDVGRCASLAPLRPASFNEPNVADQPGYVRALPLGTPAVIAASDAARRSICETLLAVDRMVDSVVTALGQTGRLANTYVMLMNDNGYHFGEHRLFRRKETLFEESVRMAFAIRGPAIARRLDRSHLVQMADVTPTLLDWAGVPGALPVDGLSLRPILANPSAPWRTELLLENLDPLPTNETATGLRDALWSYHEYTNGDRALYDMRADSLQVTNQAANPAYAAIVAQLAARLAALRSQ